MIGKPNPLKKTGRSVFRCLVPMDSIMADPLTAPLFKDQATGLFGPNIPAHDVICGSYPCRSNKVMNVAYMHPTKPEDMDKDSWNIPASIEDVSQVTKLFHPAIQELPKKAENIGMYNMMFREEIPTFVKGRAVLIGDAAHPMLTCKSGDDDNFFMADKLQFTHKVHRCLSNQLVPWVFSLTMFQRRVSRLD